MQRKCNEKRREKTDEKTIFKTGNEYRDSSVPCGRITLDDGKPKETTDDKEKSEEILRNVNYIIRTDEVDHGVIRLSGTTKVVGNGKEYDTAKETQEVIIRVETADGYQLDAVKNGDALLTKNADGTYTLVVPRGGGIQLSAVLSAIKKNENEMNGGSDDSDDSGNPPTGYGEKKGKAVTSMREKRSAVSHKQYHIRAEGAGSEGQTPKGTGCFEGEEPETVLPLRRSRRDKKMQKDEL